MICIPNEEVICFEDPDCKVRLMRKYGHCTPFEGTNSEGERIVLSIAPESILLETYQRNGWIRQNWYDENGFPNGETFAGKWNKPDPEEENTVWLVIEHLYEAGVVHVYAFKTHEAASAEYERMKKEYGAGDAMERREHYHVFGQVTLEVRRSVIRDA